METYYSGFLAFIVAFAIVIIELVTSNYSQTFFVLYKNKFLYAYGLIYGLIAFIITLAFNFLTSNDFITVEGLGLSSPYIRAILLGISIKSLLHINLVTVKVGSNSTPIGLETIVQIFEPTLERSILLDEWNGLRTYIAPYVKKHKNLANNKEIAKNNIPEPLSKEEKAALEKDIDNADNVTELFELVVRNLGRKTLKRIFPLND
jgi:hypothetical protein